MPDRKFRSALFLVGLVWQSFGFTALSTSCRKLHPNIQTMDTASSRSSLSAFSMPDDSIVDSPLLTTMSSLLLSMSTTSSTALLDPNVEAEVLTDMSHLALDFTSLLNSSSKKALLKRSLVIGRVLVILADYLPDHSIHPEELVIQLFMLGLAIKNLASSPSMEN
jgi:hypothetical protein